MSEVKMPDADKLREEYPSNSRMFPSQDSGENKEQKKVSKVVDGASIVKKSDLGSRIAGYFHSDDFRDIVKYVKDDMIIPSVKAGIMSIVEMMLFHEASGYGQWRPTDYSRYGSRNPGKNDSRRTTVNRNIRTARSVNGLKEIRYNTRAEAQAVLRVLDELIDEYGEASVMQYYDSSDVDSDFTDAKWGWKDLSKSYIYPIPGGFSIKMPLPILLE